MALALLPGEPCQVPEDHNVPQLFWEDDRFTVVLMRQAYKDLDYLWCLLDVDRIFNVPAINLMARIRRHAQGRALTIPTQLNFEASPFYAIKSVECEDWELHKKEKRSWRELTQLRAYFWEEDSTGENLMCITHFIIKTRRKLQPEDTEISRSERKYFLGTKCKYSAEKWN